MNFLEVAEGLEQGKVYRHKSWHKRLYICKNSHGIIQESQGYDTKDIVLKNEHILSTDWEECPKANWYVLLVDKERLAIDSDDKNILCRLTTKLGSYHYWNCLELTLHELKKHRYFINIEFEEQRFSEDELQKLKEIVRQK